MLMDGRFDQHFAELFATSQVDKGQTEEHPSLWPLFFACVTGLAIFALAALLG